MIMTAPMAVTITSEFSEIANEAGSLNVATMPASRVTAPAQMVLFFSFGFEFMLFYLVGV
tara:strand:- start:3430 stop:3609 length:180 start_codon:yes stop_codon:yes gene_type:complete